jgi:hypothetical protein
VHRQQQKQLGGDVIEKVLLHIQTTWEKVLLLADGEGDLASWWCSTAWRDGKRTWFGAEGAEAMVIMPSYG